MLENWSIIFAYIYRKDCSEDVWSANKCRKPSYQHLKIIGSERLFPVYICILINLCKIKLNCNFNLQQCSGLQSQFWIESSYQGKQWKIRILQILLFSWLFMIDIKEDIVYAPLLLSLITRGTCYYRRAIPQGRYSAHCYLWGPVVYHVLHQRGHMDIISMYFDCTLCMNFYSQTALTSKDYCKNHTQIVTNAEHWSAVYTNSNSSIINAP